MEEETVKSHSLLFCLASVNTSGTSSLLVVEVVISVSLAVLLFGCLDFLLFRCGSVFFTPPSFILFFIV